MPDSALPPPTPQLPDDAAIGADRRPQHSRERRLGDFTTGLSVLRLVPLGVAVGMLSAFVALGLLDLIGLVTNLLFFQRASVRLVSPRAIGPATLLIPVLGGGVIGLMARYGSERIRGHGIPEAMETILVGGSTVQPRLAVLKPISSAVSIGTGGPFGAEGPIILTGGAIGSVVGQFFHFSALERRILLVAGAAGGMSAVFGTPVAAVLLGVELLLFEWKPRSMVVVAISSAVAAAVRQRFAAWGLVSHTPLFTVPGHGTLDESALLSAMLVGVAGGLLAWTLTVAVYGAEDAFKKLPLHWAWWPAIGGVVVGVGGLLDQRALGVGYDTIAAELAGRLTLGALAALLVVKLVVWAVALGSGTSGGILAPLLMMGAAVGGMMAPVLPGGQGTAVWCLMGMAAALAGVTRSPFTAVVFAFELTRDANALLPLLIACTFAHLISVLALRRSILTEKVARRGFHVMREYVVDPLEALFVRDVMSTSVLTVAPAHSAADLYAILRGGSAQRRQRLYPVVDPQRSILGVVAWSDVLEAHAAGADGQPVAALMHRDPVLAHADETLRQLADRMAARSVGVMPVVERESPSTLRGIVSQFDLLRARERLLEEERHREQVLRVRAVPVLGRLRRGVFSDA
jgi:H+/Cl- antiporter ClcA/predicted transcriptional regulator